MDKTRVSIVGSSGYVGGELARILFNHENVELHQFTCEKNAGKKVSLIHPNLRNRVNKKFIPVSELEETDFLFIAVPHGITNKELPNYMELSGKIIDLSADYRLNEKEKYLEWYGFEHQNPELLERTVYGIPELHREKIKKADIVAAPGCGATSMIFSLWPLRNFAETVVFDLKFGSSASGSNFSLATHHAERSRVVRPFKPFLHRHLAEVEQETGVQADATAHAIELVRGILATGHFTLKEPLNEKEIWKLFRKAYSDEFFVRIVKERQGVYRFPEPKIVAGTNIVDTGFSVDPRSGRVIVFTAIDNLCRGSAGQAVQCMNLMMDFPETTALNDLGLHPI